MPGSGLGGAISVAVQSDIFPAGQPFRFVDPNAGSNSNSGLSMTKAMATIQYAYDSLPSSAGECGMIILLPGRHDVGTGFLGNGNRKCAIITSVTGDRAWHNNVSSYQAAPQIYTSANATYFFTLGYAGVNDEGWVFSGLNFDMSDSDTVWAIEANCVNYAMVRNCGFASATDVGTDRQAIRARIQGGGDDFLLVEGFENNFCKNVGLCDMGNGPGYNCNGHVIEKNVIFPGAYSTGIILRGASRCWSAFNNIEGGPEPAYLLESVKHSGFVFDAGEEGNGFDYWIDGDSGCAANYYLPVGFQDTTTPPLIKDANNAGSVNFYPQNLFLPRIYGITANANVDANWLGAIVTCTHATGLTCSGGPVTSTSRTPKGWSCEFIQQGAGQITFNGAGGGTLQSKNTWRKSSIQYARVKLTLIDTVSHIWNLSGDLSA